MHTRTRTLYSIILVFVLALSPACARAKMPAAPPDTRTTTSGTHEAGSAATDVAPIKRFMLVDANLYRGAQPDETGFRHLRDIGVDTVISLRTDDGERALVESLGMKWVHIPVSFRPFGWGGDFSADHVRRFFAVIDAPESGIVFFHCKRGADRTGAMAGLYRMARQGWSLDKAFDEARDIGMRWWYFPVKGKMRSFASLVASPALSQ